MKRLLSLLLIGAITPLYSMSEVPSSQNDAQKEILGQSPQAPQEELDPIARLRLAYAHQKRPVLKKDPEYLEGKSPKKPNPLFDMALNYLADAGTSYALGYAIKTYVQEEQVDHPKLIKDSLFNALRIPSILDTIYRIPLKKLKGKNNPTEEVSEGYEIARTFVEDTVVGCAVNYTYHGAILREELDHHRIIGASVIGALRLPMIGELGVRYAYEQYVLPWLRS